MTPRTRLWLAGVVALGSFFLLSAGHLALSAAFLVVDWSFEARELLSLALPFASVLLCTEVVKGVAGPQRGGRILAALLGTGVALRAILLAALSVPLIQAAADAGGRPYYELLLLVTRYLSAGAALPMVLYLAREREQDDGLLELED